MTVRYYKNAPSHTIPGGVANASTTTITLDSVVGWPTQFPFSCVIEPDLALEEIVDVTNIVGLVATVVRGIDGSTASAHAAGSVMVPSFIARDATEANAHINATSGIHGATGSLVDTGSNQTISGNKTLSGTTALNGPTTLGGTTTVNGVTTFNGGVLLDSLALHNIQPTTQVFTASGTWNKPANLKFIVVKMTGGAGASGAGITTGANQGAAGGGGGGGQTVYAIIPASALGSSVTVTIGAGGTAPAGNGSDTTFGTLLTAKAGQGGTNCPAPALNSVTAGGAGGTGTGGSVTPLARFDGQSGTPGRVFGGIAMGGRGGAAGLGFGQGAPEGNSVSNAPGVAGKLYGGGASGGGNGPSITPGAAGADGAAGIVIVEEYYS